MIDATHVKAHTALPRVKAKRGGRCIGRTAGGLHSKPHACDSNGRVRYAHRPDRRAAQG